MSESASASGDCSDDVPRRGASAEERHRTIESLIATEGRVGVTDLSAQLSVTDETIRRDLKLLEDQGKLSREHGGAVGPAANPLPWLEKSQSGDIDRKFIDRLLQEVPDEGVIYVDGGPVAERLILELPESSRVNLVTPSIDIAMTSTEHANIETYSLGGQVDPVTGVMTGAWAHATLARLRIDVAVFTTVGQLSDEEVGAAPGLAVLQAEVLARANRKVLAVSTGERESANFVVYAKLADFDAVISDTVTYEPLGE
ncbi:MAG: DeoR/GlpR family DNA-binding transcription regulator [Leucobacter sp.]